MKNRLLAMLLVLAMVVSLVPAAAAAESTAVSADAVETTVTGAVDQTTVTVSGSDEKPVPTLKEGVEAIAYGQTVTGRNYDVEVLQKNQIFDAPEGETLNYASYWYVRSTDGGQTWSETPRNFPPLKSWKRPPFHTNPVRGIKTE